MPQLGVRRGFGILDFCFYFGILGGCAGELTGGAGLFVGGGFEGGLGEGGALGGAVVGGAEEGVLDVAASEVVGAGEFGEVEVKARGLGGDEGAPDGFALGGVGGGEADLEEDAAGEGGVHVGFEVGGEEEGAVEALHFLEEVVDGHVLVAVLGALDGDALGEEGVGFVEEEDGVLGLGLGEEVVEVLLGFADPF
jgi:hypothetical protein